MTEQQQELDRVTTKLRDTIVEYFHVLGIGAQFNMRQLLTWVDGRGMALAPDSVSRVMRALRQAHALNYRVVNRRASLYEVVA